ncbi:MAG TPA: hypothetical protein PKB02_09560, partial [Anaerohalosphaeraceae bacterium]|nr:hypothetical protein [Anaerohalosphaeraceae bacterium]
MTATTAKPRYIIKPLAITQDSRLSYAEQDYLCLIWQLHNAKGCTASNKYFARYFNVARPRVSEVITSLKNKGIIQTIEAREGKNITGRTIIIIDESIKDSLTVCTKNYLSGGDKETPGRGDKKSPVGGAKKSPEEKIDIESKYKNIFNEARLLFPGSKRGNDTEFDNFTNAKDWREVLPKLLPAIQREISHKKYLTDSGKFCPAWKNFKTW